MLAASEMMAMFFSPSMKEYFSRMLTIFWPSCTQDIKLKAGEPNTTTVTVCNTMHCGHGKAGSRMMGSPVHICGFWSSTDTRGEAGCQLVASRDLDVALIGTQMQLISQIYWLHQ